MHNQDYVFPMDSLANQKINNLLGDDTPNNEVKEENTIESDYTMTDAVKFRAAAGNNDEKSHIGRASNTRKRNTNIVNSDDLFVTDPKRAKTKAGELKKYSVSAMYDASSSSDHPSPPPAKARKVNPKKDLTAVKKAGGALKKPVKSTNNAKITLPNESVGGELDTHKRSPVKVPRGGKSDARVAARGGHQHSLQATVSDEDENEDYEDETDMEEASVYAPNLRNHYQETGPYDPGYQGGAQGFTNKDCHDQGLRASENFRRSQNLYGGQVPYDARPSYDPYLSQHGIVPPIHMANVHPAYPNYPTHLPYRHGYPPRPGTHRYPGMNRPAGPFPYPTYPPPLHPFGVSGPTMNSTIARPIDIDPYNGGAASSYSTQQATAAPSNSPLTDANDRFEHLQRPRGRIYVEGGAVMVEVCPCCRRGFGNKPNDLEES